MTFLRGNKTYLRALESTDYAFLETVENDRSLWEVSGTLKPFSKEILTDYLNNAQQDIYKALQFRFVICRISTNKPVGFVDLFDFDNQNKRAGIGIVITKKNRQKGYAKDALKTLIKYSFKILKLHQLYANILEHNTVSFNLFTKLNFEVIGLKKDWNYYQKKFKNEWLLQLINKND